MTYEEMNTALYHKMSAEQDKFRDWLLTQPPEEILKHTYEYTVREDIVLAMEYLDLPDAQVTALLSSPSPLGDVFHEYENLETNYMDTIRDCIETRANNMLGTRTASKEQTGKAVRPSIKEQLAAPPVPGGKPPTDIKQDREVR